MGFDTHDDAGVYLIDENKALISTADFITPPIDDAFVFGQIAAANALSDIYAMGGTPLSCLNLVSFPSKKLPAETLHEIIRGALNKIHEAGAVLLGGHSVEDEEPKFGLSVTGWVHPQKIWRNSGARVGDHLILTKPIGSGVLFNAHLSKHLSTEKLQECLHYTTMLNKTAAEVMQGGEVHAATDITGFGLAGHAWEVAEGSNVLLEIESAEIPLMKNALAMYERGVTTGVNSQNRAVIAHALSFDKRIPVMLQELTFDPQTGGGLLLAVPPEDSASLLQKLHESGVTAAKKIGAVHEAEEGRKLRFIS